MKKTTGKATEGKGSQAREILTSNTKTSLLVMEESAWFPPQ
jgi:hypothetical protein